MSLDDYQSAVRAVRSWIVQHGLDWSIIGAHPVLSNAIESDPLWKNQVIAMRLPAVAIVVRPPQMFLDLLLASIPLIACVHPVKHREVISQTLIDDSAVGRIAANHLVAAGARTFAIQGPQESLVPITGNIQARILRSQAFIARMQALGHEVRIVLKEGWTADESHDKIKRFVADSPKPVGFFCYQDRQAAWLVQILLAQGISIPAEALIIGCDDSPTARYCTPALTSVRMPIEGCVREAALIAQRLLSGSPIGQTTKYFPPAGIAERASTAVDPNGSDVHLDRAIRRANDLDKVMPTVAVLAKAAGFNRRTLHTRFLARFGCGTKEWLLRRAIQRAEHLLTTTDLAEADIAKRCGWRRAEHFITVFRTRTGRTPGAFRSLGGGGA
ncbi:hypothetical protein LBMAG53_21570 [Planctomycetota bacterium]|nr:hypothetical protein LBMAG53_21570 [Planctomycetota bacterium]